MNQAHEALRTLLDAFPTAELDTEDQRSTFEAIRHRLTASSDPVGELKLLYKVQGFSDVAITLLWAADRVEKAGTPSAGPEDASLLLTAFRGATGGAVPAMPGGVAVQDDDNPFAAFGADQPSSPPADEQPSSLEGFGSAREADQFDSPDHSQSAATFSGDEKEFSTLLDQFVEAMQSGDDRRVSLLDQVVAACSVIGAGESTDDFKEYCRALTEFLTYISQNQFLDDVRVMNILSNVSSPVSQWAATPPAERAGVLEEGIAPLREFKSLFE